MEALHNHPGRRGLIATLVATVLLALVPSGASAARMKSPNDRAFAAQWQLTTDAGMGVRSAWNVTTAGSAVVAVVDTGAELGHPDLAANLWTNTGEIAGNGIDDDANGFVDDVHGYDFAGKDADPTDENGHGTHVAGIIGARGNNGTGVTGVAWHAQLMIVRVLDAKGSGSVYDVARGIRYAVANGAKIVNLSMAGPDNDPALEAAIAEAKAAGVLIVAAAGNAGADLDATPAYPASSASDNVIAVASTDEDGHLAPGSSYGAATVDVTAPGENIDSTDLHGYGVRSGTSQAAANVSGVLALMAGAQPAATADQLRAQLLATTKANGLPVAAGGVDAGAAVRSLLGLPAPRAAKRKVSSRATARKASARRTTLRKAPAPLTVG
ncbi:MAG: S8 family peptidase [Solirubrobacteraceae bacterium]